MSSILFDKSLISRYDKTGPRYTSYPTAVQFHEGFTEDEYTDIARQTNEDLIPLPLSLYFHLPFCDTVCFYCACNKVITKNRNHADSYLTAMHREIEIEAELFDKDRVVKQLHWGGGTPTFISNKQMSDLMQVTRKHFNLLEDDSGEYAVEIDPREANYETIVLLRDIGFNRMSIGVQDFDPDVQKAVNRIQTFEKTAEVLESARNKGFRSINFDLIYGLPLQTLQSFEETLNKVLKLKPDRIALYNYAHLPELFKTQKQINTDELPSATVKLEILKYSINCLTENGYVYIGMDHFARPEDELAVAQQNGTLHRNFQGYSTCADTDIIGFGITAISKVGDSYLQNVRDIDEYESMIMQGKKPVFRGILLDEDDLLRREVILALICNFRLDYEQIEEQCRVNFKKYFSAELDRLSIMEQDGLTELDTERMTVTPAGRLLIRNICMVFDKYIDETVGPGRYSKLI